MNIRFRTIRDVYEFVKMSQCLPCELDLIQGRYIVDGKSLMGIFSLDLQQPIRLDSHGCNVTEELKHYLEE